MSEPSIVVRDRQTGHTYKVSEARFRRTPELWERVGTDPAKPKTTVAKAAAKKKAASPATTESDPSGPDQEAGSTATQKEDD